MDLYGLAQLISTAVNVRLSANLSGLLGKLNKKDAGWWNRDTEEKPTNATTFDKSSAEVAEAESKYHEALANTQKPDQLEEAAKGYESALAAAEAELKRVTAAHAEIVARLKGGFWHKNDPKETVSGGDGGWWNRDQAKARMGKDFEKFEASQQSVKAAEQQRQEAAEAVKTNANELGEASEAYRQSLERAEQELNRVTEAHEKLVLDLLSEHDRNRLERGARDVDRLSSKRDELVDRKSLATQSLNALIADKNSTPGEVRRMAERVRRLDERAEAIERILKEARERQQQRVEDVEGKLKNRLSDERHEIRTTDREKRFGTKKGPKTFMQKARRARIKARRLAGSAGRKAMDKIESFFKDISDPQRARANYQSAQAKNAVASAAAVAAPGPGTAAAATATNFNATMAGMKVALADALQGLKQVFAFTREAIKQIAKVAGAALVFVATQQIAGEAAVERMRRNRSRFSGQIAGAVGQYDLQSLMLEARSSQGTSGSGAAVAKATMALRESNQNRSEKWEDIGNRILATTIDLATMVSSILESVDILTPAAGFLVDIGRKILEKFGLKLTEIADNSRKGENVGLDSIRQFWLQNNMTAGSKEFPDLKKKKKPIKPIK